MDTYDEEILLAKWLAGELDDAGWAAIEQLPHLAELNEAIAFIDTQDVPTPNLEQIRQKIESKKKPDNPRRMTPRVWMSIAAALILGVFVWFLSVDRPVLLETAKAEQNEYTLPDDSHVILNASSSIQYYKGQWKKERTLLLEGEAFFKVQKGRTFTVETEQGDVEVVGTQFNVLSRWDVFEVVCYEGVVRVRTSSLDTLLSAGAGIDINENGVQHFASKEKAPGWLNRILTFRQKKLSFVFEELERQFDIDIDFSQINGRKRFSGGVPLDDKKLALEIVCKAMTLKYEFSSDNKKVVIMP